MKFHAEVNDAFLAALAASNLPDAADIAVHAAEVSINWQVRKAINTLKEARMAGSADPGYNPDIKRIPIPDYEGTAAEELPNLNRVIEVSDPPVLADELIGDTNPPGHPFIRVVSPSGQVDTLTGMIDPGTTNDAITNQDNTPQGAQPFTDV